MKVKVIDANGALSTRVCELYRFGYSNNCIGLEDVRSSESPLSLPTVVVESSQGRKGKYHTIGDSGSKLLLVAESVDLRRWGLVPPRTAHFISTNSSFETFTGAKSKPVKKRLQFKLFGGKNSESYLWTLSKAPSQRHTDTKSILAQDVISKEKLLRHLLLHQLLGSKRSDRDFYLAMYRASEILLGIEECKFIDDKTGYLRRAFSPTQVLHTLLSNLEQLKSQTNTRLPDPFEGFSFVKDRAPMI